MVQSFFVYKQKKQSKNMFFKERVKRSFLVTFNTIISHIFPENFPEKLF